MIKLPMKTTVFLVSVTSPLPPPYVPRLDITQVIYILLIATEQAQVIIVLN